jgi:hypothetical protein
VDGIIAAALKLHTIARKKASVVNRGKKIKFEVDDAGKAIRKKKVKKPKKKGKRKDRGQRNDSPLTGDDDLLEPEERSGFRPGGGGGGGRLKKPKKKRKFRSRTVYKNSSRPPESPRRRTGFGQKNIVFGFDRSKKQARVGYTRAARYMTFHELGIRYSKVGLQRRPTIVPALADNLLVLRRVYTKAALRSFNENTPSNVKARKSKS